ncbi:MAG: excinuclease ABC subunit UvrA [Chloroflexi bacterium]|jgi:excinuclease ABC subunit A|nr:excinuclease ABC subunit UvrA [Chloroflexota bacterium]
MHQDEIVIRGAREHNLQDVDITLPRLKLVVLTGVSGSGKSSLAFDTLYAEGQRRYVESLSAYARQFIGQMEKPKVDYIGGLSPAIAIEQKAVSKNPRSTVATVTEIYDYLRVLYARVGTPHCPQCGREVHAQSAQEIVEQVAALPPGTRYQILAPLARNRKGTFQDVLAQAKADGFARVRVNGQVLSLEDKIVLDKKKKHDIELVVDRLAAPAEGEGPLDAYLTRLTDSIETALQLGEGLVIIDRGNGEDWLLSEQNSCPDCGISFPELSPAMFSFNSPLGMCPDCNGLGTKFEFDAKLFVDPEKTVAQGGVRVWGELRKKKTSGTYQMAEMILQQFGHDMNTPWRDLSPECQKAILYGGIHVTWKWENERGSGQHEGKVEGVYNWVRRCYHQTKSEGMRRWYTSFMSQQPCPTCGGLRLRPEVLAVTVGDKTIDQVTRASISEAMAWVESLRGGALTAEQQQIADEVLKEIHGRLQFLINVGLHYLTLDRPARTLSGGEGQRIRLASQVGCGLVGVLYVLDEPSIGLHQRDNRRLLNTLEQLRDMGNTVVVVEHDEETMQTADWLVDLGPGAGIRGGRVVAEGTPEQVMANPQSLTGRYLANELQVSSPTGQRRPTNGKWLTIVGARQNNLRNLDVRFPLGLFTCVTGVSGSGKSSLVAQTLYPALARALHGASTSPGDYTRIDGLEQVGKVINITQEPIGRTPRSNPATYVQVMDPIRELFALTPEAGVRGYKPGRFSFNVKGGRCEACEGHGQKRVEMHFLPDVWVTCNVCKGKRFNRETLQVRYKGKNIADVLDMEVDEALEFFANVPKVSRILQTLADVGLGYIKLGQSATTLSGGEAQRVKLAKELARVATGDTVYILDEPTTGLHFADIQKLLDVLHRLTDAGNTVIVIEHNLDVIKTADWVIDLGPEGGDAGGQLVAQGTPEEVTQVEASHTGRFLRDILRHMPIVTTLDAQVQEAML